MKSILLFIISSHLILFGFSQTPKLVKDINTGSGSGNPKELLDYNGILFFTADDGINGREAWITTGTPNSTTMIMDQFPGNGGSLYDRNPTVFNGEVYYIAEGDTTGKELWRTDGNSTNLVMDIYPGPGSSLNAGASCACLTVAGGLLFLNPRDGIGINATYGTELWKTDGSNIEIVEDIYPGNNSGIPNDLVALGNKVFFSANDNVHGRELWYSDGSNTMMVKDIIAGAQGSEPEDLVVAGGKVFFTAFHPTYGREMWVSDGTANGTTLISDIAPGSDNSNIEFAYGGSQQVYFSADNGMDGKELYTSDGNGVTMHDINPGSGDSKARFFIEVGSQVFFYAENGVDGAELWIIKNGNVSMVKNINQGNGSSFPNYFTAVGNGVYFSAASALWYSDGTANGTFEVVGADDGISTIRNTALSGGNLYFTANGYDFNGQTLGYELFVLENVSGINSPDNPELSFQISPNPASDMLQVSLPELPNNEIPRVNVYNQLGQKLIQTELLSNRIDVSDLVPGIYWIEIITGKVRGMQEVQIVR